MKLEVGEFYLTEDGRTIKAYHTDNTIKEYIDNA